MKIHNPVLLPSALISSLLFLLLACPNLAAEDRLFGQQVSWDSVSLLIGGRRVVPAMGEIHYSRVPADEWKTEISKMKQGGINMIACYVFWNHIEEEEGQFDWSGQRDLRRFLKFCKETGMPVVLRVGPFCHGEVRLGGIPDWIYTKQCKPRTEDPLFLKYVARLYRQIFTQVQGLQWKDGGPVIACQFDNEFGGPASYLLALKHLAQSIGFDLPFYTRTGWPGLSTPMPYGEMIPLFGDYADGFWDRSIKETSGNYWQAFFFKPSRVGADMGDLSSKMSGKGKTSMRYPYFTCELGGGMMTSYHRRVYLYPEDAYSMAIVKLGSGSNLLGYYMYHGGTNPEGKLTYLNEMQRTRATNYNDLPVKTYDFQAPIGEFGELRPHYYMLRKLHLFMNSFGQLLAPMEAHFPNADKTPTKGDDSYLRWSYRSDGNSAFVFVNNYERLQHLSAKNGVQFSVCGKTFPRKPITIPAGTMAILPVNIHAGDVNIDYAMAQIICGYSQDGRTKLYLQQLNGIKPEMSINGRVKTNLKTVGTGHPVYSYGKTDIYLVSSEDAGHLGLKNELKTVSSKVSWHKERDARGERTITIGVNHVAEEPVDSDFDRAAVYIIDVNSHEGLLDILYRGDVARLYANGKLIDDNFYNGRHFFYGLWRLPEDCHQLELRILPLQKGEPVYFPREADATPGEKLISVTRIEQENSHK